MAERGEKCEIQVLEVRPSGTKVKYGLHPGDEDVSCALVAERKYSDKNILESTTLLINSKFLLRIFKSIVSYYPAVPADFAVPLTIESPFQILFHYWDELHAAKENAELGDEARMHLNLLLEFMHQEMGPAKERVDSMLRAGSVAFTTAWTIFRPGCLLYTQEDGHPWFLRLEKTAYEENRSVGKFLELQCRYTDYDGETHGRAEHRIRILQKTYFAAETPCRVKALPIFPADWLPDKEALEERLAERGSKFLAIQGYQVQNYHGTARYLKEPPASYWHWDMEDFAAVWLAYTETGRIVLDQKTFKEEFYSAGVSLSTFDVTAKSERMLCPPYIAGYSLARKDWCRFYIDSISNVNWNGRAFEDLVLAEERKSVLEALVTSHDFSSDVRDQAKQKGRGLVILLHGTPGSGKTLSAESAAEVTKKALLSATIGDLNRDDWPASFERHLKRLLQYATIWKAIVLLDEADVFLEGRTEAAGVGKDHNALVAVFLKHLEYFSGIIFLTSNRVNVFDTAMVSRIHLALEYKPPGPDMRRVIWMNCLKAIPEDELAIDVEEDVDHFLRESLNGREIANCIHTARTLARFKGEILEVKHVDTVLNTRRDFEKSVYQIKESWQHRKESTKMGQFQLTRRNTLETADD